MQELSKSARVEAPEEDRFPTYPVSWYLFCRSNELTRKPLSKQFLGHRLVGYRTAQGRVVIMNGACAHLGSDLGQGRLIGDAIECPFHNWRFGTDGRCTLIPAQETIPAFAKQMTYPVQEQNGFVFVFNDREPRFPLPFFPDCDPTEFTAGKPFGAVLDCPWYMTAANAFDLQHFRAAHDRRLQADPQVHRPAPFAFQALGEFAVAGSSWRDHVTRWFAGDEVKLGITDWCGTLSFATAKFRRTTSYGLVVREPLPSGVRVQVIVFTKRRRSWLGQAVVDRGNLAIRRYFIRKFLTADAIRLNGVRYNRHTLIECDQEMIQYFHWLASTANGIPVPVH